MITDGGTIQSQCSFVDSVQIMCHVLCMESVLSLVNVSWKVSNPGLISLLFFLWKVSYPGHWHQNCKRIRLGTQSIGQLLFIRFTPEFLYLVPQRDILGHGTKIARGLGWVHKASVSYCSLGLLLNSSTWCRREISWSRHQNLQEGLDGYMGFQHKFMSIKSMGLLKPGATKMSRHQNCKRCPSISL